MPPSDDLRAELQRRGNCADKPGALLKARPVEWIPMQELAAVGGIGGWRTRLSELGRRKVDPLRIEHNGKNGHLSAHRYLPSVPTSWPVFDAPSQEPWTLKP